MLDRLTKPDLCESIGLEDKFIDLVNNKDKANVFKLGWYVLLNPGPREPGQPWPTTRERKQREEDFFGRGKWRSLPTDMCGADALKAKLSVQLQRHIGRHVKTLRRQIQKALDETDTELKGMGEGKDTPEEMRIELVELFSASKELVIPAVYGFYKNPPGKNFFRSTADPRGTPAQNLRARAAEENEAFSARIRQHGRKFGFASSSGGGPGPGTSAEASSEAQKQNYVRQEVEMLLTQIRGSEFPGDAKPRAVYMLFQSYSEYWPRLAQEHKDNLGVVCDEFLSELIAYAWPERMREPLRREFLDPQVAALMEKAQRELDLLTQDCALEVQPYDPEYEEKLRRWQNESSSREGGPGYSEAQEVLEKMLIYYDLTARCFIRNVIMQVVERHLLQGMYSIFESVKCLAMSVDAVEAIAAENRETRERRVKLKQRKRAIEEAKAVCASLAMRKELRAYAHEAGPAEDEETSDEEDAGAAPPRRNVSARSANGAASVPARPPPRRKEAPTGTTNGGGYNANGESTAAYPVRTRTAAQYQAEEDYYQQQHTSPTSRGPPPPPASAAAPPLPAQAPPPPPPRPDKVSVEDRSPAYYAHVSSGGGRPSLEEYGEGSGSFSSVNGSMGASKRGGQFRKILGRV